MKQEQVTIQRVTKTRHQKMVRRAVASRLTHCGFQISHLSMHRRKAAELCASVNTP
ncbi:MAG: hypothetical protein QOH71_3794 [Blastocatellia bacterium]|jgi:hypothetical protein|nr:hypothetical protein [Blastocatellia bacterium]